MIITVTLPLLKATATILEAVQRLQDSRKSAVVIDDDRGPIVVTDRSLSNALTTQGDLPLSRIADRARPSLLGGGTVLAEAQRKYIVRGVEDGTALVDADAEVAKELAQESKVKF